MVDLKRLRAHPDNKTKQAMQRDCELAADNIEALLKDAERYRWHRARNPGALLASAWGASSMACAIGDDPDAATDAAMAEFVLPNVAIKRAPL